MLRRVNEEEISVEGLEKVARENKDHRLARKYMLADLASVLKGMGREEDSKAIAGLISE